MVVPGEDLAYRWTKNDSTLKEQKKAEWNKYGIDDAYAFDDEMGNPVKFIELETEEDFLEKLASVFNQDYTFDRRISMPLNLTDEEFLLLAKSAHEADQTINTFISNLLEQHIEEFKAKSQNNLSLISKTEHSHNKSVVSSF